MKVNWHGFACQQGLSNLSYRRLAYIAFNNSAGLSGQSPWKQAEAACFTFPSNRPVLHIFNRLSVKAFIYFRKPSSNDALS